MKHTLVFILTLSMVVFGCSKSQVKDYLVEPTYSNQLTIVTILPISGVDKKYAECVKMELANNISELKIIPEEIFRDALFPWFESSTAPKSIEDLGTTMNRPLVLDRIRRIGIRYVIFVGGSKIKEQFSGPFIVVGGFGAAGAFGYTSSDRTTEITAVIWDLEREISLGEVEVEKSGSFKWIGIILPIPIPVFTESNACSEAAKRISNCLTGKGLHMDELDN